MILNFDVQKNSFDFEENEKRASLTQVGQKKAISSVGKWVKVVNFPPLSKHFRKEKSFDEIAFLLLFFLQRQMSAIQAANSGSSPASGAADLADLLARELARNEELQNRVRIWQLVFFNIRISFSENCCKNFRC